MPLIAFHRANSLSVLIYKIPGLIPIIQPTQ